MKNHTAATPSLLGVFVLVAIILGMLITVTLHSGDSSEQANGNWKSNKKNITKEVSNDTGKKLIDKVKIQYIKFQ
ncbi:hypothetical protein [uncultured Microscilla sp.]|uniref:hypothetical protein n=1 Tax=uncultured Microscilla sp. TaxID=432653 RepID=UPI0026178A8A|nr:hypothetical protein [uncultured Microscilla sp.]